LYVYVKRGFLRTWARKLPLGIVVVLSPRKELGGFRLKCCHSLHVRNETVADP
jgi:hypothetical protein